MKSIIVYATKTGFVGECVEKLASQLGGDVEKINIAGRPPRIDLEKYDRIIIGGSIRAGKIQKSIKIFCAQNFSLLAKKKVGLFISCLAPTSEAEKYFGQNFSQSLVALATAKGCFGGAVYFERMNALERFIMKKITKKTESFTDLREENITAFAQAMK